MTFLFSPAIKQCCAPGDSYPPYTVNECLLISIPRKDPGCGLRMYPIVISTPIPVEDTSGQRKFLSTLQFFVSGAANLQSPALVVKAC
ncbi:no significant blast hit [Histoplasma capsulatum var. duboisii H88]|uniref:No significant blast hit n=1 Tax=Ajellomyces capsulatus (strain H88) TaxID=544711 RepID=A0A8A1L986_AJEC8|nr:no significant blast hit [Histoplasma capsulatum var. duboisii H88]